MSIAVSIAPGAVPGHRQDDCIELLTVDYRDSTEPASPAPGMARAWVVVADPADALAARLAQSLGDGGDVEAVGLEEVPERLEGALARGALRHSAGRVIFFAPPAEARSEAHGFEQRWAWAAHLIRTAQAIALSSGFELWIVTRTGAGRAADGACPEHQFALGAARALAAESPKTLGGVVEVDADLADSGRLARLLQGETLEDEILLSETGLRVPRLTAVAASPQPLRLDPGATYLITGGLGGLALELARWLPGRNARHLLVVGRSALDPARNDALAELSRLYATVEYRQLDVGDEAAVRGFTESIGGAGAGRLGGVFHLASSWQRNGKSAVLPLALLAPEDVLEVLRAKGEGSRLMDRLADRLAADFIVYFSTASATIGSPAQANYAGANAVMDGLAEHAVRQGRRALSLALGPVAQIGFGGSGGGNELHRLWEKMGVERLTLAYVFEALEAALSLGCASATAIRFSDQAWTNLPWLSKRPIYQYMFPEPSAAPAAGNRVDVGGLPAGARREQIEQQLLTGLATILCLEPDKLAVDLPLADAGVDSLVALELLFTVERTYGISMPFNEAMLDPSVTLRTVAAEVDALLLAREAGNA
jgi:erythronolide synthase